jgi:hypothetical protein
MAADVNLNVPVKTVVFVVKWTEVVTARKVSLAPAVHKVGVETTTCFPYITIAWVILCIT